MKSQCLNTVRNNFSSRTEISLFASQTPVFKIDLGKELEDFDEAEQKAEKRKDKEDQGRRTGKRGKC